MARNSHWHNIQLKKGKADAKKAGVFTKLSKGITVAAKEGGGGIAFNFKLRMAVESARAVNMTKDAIDRAIARGTGTGEGVTIEELVYEAYGPGGVGILIRCLTDNRVRTVAEVKTLIAKNSGTVAGQGSVAWMFEKKGVVTIGDASSVKDRETFELALIDVGAENFEEENGSLFITCDTTDLKRVMDAVASQSVKTDSTEFVFLAKEPVVVDLSFQEPLHALVEVLEDNDDVDAVFTNEG